MPQKDRSREFKGRAWAVDLAPLSAQEFGEFIEHQVVEYAHEKRRAGHWTAEEAVDRSRTTIRDILGTNPEARGHRFFKGLDDRGNRVGWIWVGPTPEELHLERARWLYQITVDENARGQGFGRGMLMALEDLLAGEGFEELHLNVFKWNGIARNLYNSLGYEVEMETDTEAGMRKRLTSMPRAASPR